MDRIRIGLQTELSANPHMLVRTDASNMQEYFTGSSAGETLTLVDIGGGVLQPQFTTPASGFASFIISDSTNTQTILDGNTITFAAGDLLEAVVSATDTVTYQLASGTTGDIIYYDGSNWVTLSAGTNGQVLTLASGVPSWADASGGFTSWTISDGTNTEPITDGDSLVISGSNGISTGYIAASNTMAITRVGVTERFTSLTSGSTVTIAGTLPTDNDLIQVYRNGMLAVETTHWSLAGNVITFTTAFANSTNGSGGENVTVKY